MVVEAFFAAAECSSSHRNCFKLLHLRRFQKSSALSRTPSVTLGENTALQQIFIATLCVDCKESSNLFFLFHWLFWKNVSFFKAHGWLIHCLTSKCGFSSDWEKVPHLGGTRQRCHSDTSAPGSRPPRQPSFPWWDCYSLGQTEKKMSVSFWVVGQTIFYFIYCI